MLNVDTTPVDVIVVMICDDELSETPAGFIHVTFIMSVPFIEHEKATLSCSRTVKLVGTDRCVN